MAGKSAGVMVFWGTMPTVRIAVFEREELIDTFELQLKEVAAAGEQIQAVIDTEYRGCTWKLVSE